MERDEWKNLGMANVEGKEAEQTTADKSAAENT